MGRWGRCDYRELKKLDERLQQLSEVDMDRLCRDAAKKVAQILLNKVKKRTPVGVVPSYATDEAKQEYWAGYSGGSLRDAWTILPIEKHGDQYTVTVINNLEYASYVEYGHRQTPGRYVPALGKTLKASWVPGKLMLTISEQEVKVLVPSILNDKLTGSTISATGIICGVVAVAGAFVLNCAIGVLNAIIQAIWTIFVAPFLGIVEWILNVCNGGFNSFGDAVANLIGQIIGWFLNLGKVVTTIIDAIFGTDWTSGLESLQSAVTSWGKNENAITLDKNAPTIDYRATYSGAWDAGYDFGQGIDDKIGGMFDASGLDSMGAFDLSNTLDGIYGNTGDTAANTAATADALDIAEEDLAYLRDIAEREAINRFTTAEIKVEQHNENHISKDADLDGIMDAWANDFAEKLEVSEEGVHE